MDRKEFHYHIPQELIAQDPLEVRAASRLLVLDRSDGRVTHGRFPDIAGLLEPGDCLVLNETRVLPARLLGRKDPGGAPIEFVLLHPEPGERLWNVILKPGRRAKPGARFFFGDGILRAEVVSIAADGDRIVRFEYDGIFEEILDRVGKVPLPPYIHHELKDPERYQTVYARVPGSAAAPTAGLHFTGELLDAIRAKGVVVARITLHVGTGTFRPVKEDDVTRHRMHAEWYEIPGEAAEAVNAARKAGKRVVAVGTTAARTLETAAGLAERDGEAGIRAGSGWTDIFIYPGYRFRCVDALITNFHLPESTLIMLVCAFAGTKPVLDAYREAVAARYRFFSFGDAMFIR